MDYVVPNAEGGLKRKKFVALSNHAQASPTEAGIWETALAIYERNGRFQSITVKGDVSYDDIDAEIRSLGIPLSTFGQLGSSGHSIMETTSR